MEKRGTFYKFAIIRKCYVLSSIVLSNNFDFRKKILLLIILYLKNPFFLQLETIEKRYNTRQ